MAGQQNVFGSHVMTCAGIELESQTCVNILMKFRFALILIRALGNQIRFEYTTHTGKIRADTMAPILVVHECISEFCWNCVCTAVKYVTVTLFKKRQIKTSRTSSQIIIESHFIMLMALLGSLLIIDIG